MDDNIEELETLFGVGDKVLPQAEGYMQPGAHVLVATCFVSNIRDVKMSL